MPIDTNRRRYVLLERDGVVNRRLSGPGVTCWEQFEFLPRALPGLRLFAENGYSVLIVSNQPAVGSGALSSRELDAITRRFLLEVALSGGHIEQVYYCRHASAELCNCRKPRPGLLVRAQIEHRFAPQDTFLVDDSPVALAAAAAIGCPSILIRREAFLEKRSAGDEPPILACNLHEAAERILATRPVRALQPMLVRP
jgi:D-glycero-D-manno-heptose 1,7-bisphosphate phosphatase